MYNNYDYPCGADTPDAPYNQTTPPERDFDILVCTSLSKSTYITTDKYCKNEWKDCNIEDGEKVFTGGEEVTVEPEELKESYLREEYTIPQLLECLKELAEEKLKHDCTYGEIKKMHKILESLKGWIEDEFDVMQE